MDPHSMGLQGGMSMPMSMGMAVPSGATGGNPQTMGLGMGSMGVSAAPYGVPPQQLMMNMGQMGQMGQMGAASGAMQMNPSGMNAAAVSGGMQQSGPGADWRIQVTREHRANLIAKIYNEMVRASADPVPGIKLWMNVSWYELSLYKESPTQEVYINKIFTRLKSLRAQQSDMNAAMAAQALPNQGMLSRLDFSYYNTLNLNQRSSGQVGGYPGHNQYNGPGPHPGAQQQQQKTMTPGASQVKTETGMTANVVAEYWRQHATLKAKHQADVEKVHIAFKKYVDHMKSHDETEQKKKLRYLLSYVELCSNILAEDKTTHPPRKIEELDKVFKYIVKIVNPYLKKLRTETDKRSNDGSGSSAGSDGRPSGSTTSSPAPNPGASTSSGATTMSTTTSGSFSSAMTQPQSSGQAPQQNPANGSAQNQQASMHQTPQQKQQQYMMQQRAQQMQQQRMQAQAARQQQIIQQQQMMQHQQMQQKGPTTAQQQAQFSAQQANQMKQQQQQNSQNAANQQGGQQTQQQIPQQAPVRPQQASQPQQNPVQQQQQQQKPQQPLQLQQQNQQAPTSRGESPSISSGLSLGLDDSLYSGMSSSDLLQMPTPSGSNSGYMDFSNALSPTSFGGMDLLDWDDGTPGQGGSGQGNNNATGGEDLMSFVETL